MNGELAIWSLEVMVALACMCGCRENENLGFMFLSIVYCGWCGHVRLYICRCGALYECVSMCECEALCVCVCVYVGASYCVFHLIFFFNLIESGLIRSEYNLIGLKKIHLFDFAFQSASDPNSIYLN